MSGRIEGGGRIALFFNNINNCSGHRNKFFVEDLVRVFIGKPKMMKLFNVRQLFEVLP